MDTFHRHTTASDPKFQRVRLLLNAVNKRTRSSLLHDECVSNPPLRGERFRPWDGKLLTLNRFLLGKRKDLIQFLNDGDHVFPLRPTVLGMR